MFFYYTTLAMFLGIILDFLFGDPRWLYHPVIAIGKLISFLEKRIRKVFPKSPVGERMGGRLEVILVCLITAGVPFTVLFLLYKYIPVVGCIVETFWCYQMIATKSLKKESMKVHTALKKGTIEDARFAVSMIVGRDTQELDEIGVTKAAVETVAENTSDGIIAPLFYMAIGGVPLMFFYKGINTMDSMLGYKNEKYINFGRCAALLDDVVNYIPARLSGWLMILAAYMMNFDGKNARKIFLRDRRNHSSPNSAQTESVMAGALNIQLAGNAFYFGKLYEKPTIGDANRAVEIEDIPRANKILYGTVIIGGILFLLIRLLVIYLIAGF